MNDADVLKQIEDIVRAHPNQDVESYARMLQQQFRDRPTIGFLLLAWAGEHGLSLDQGGEHG